MQGQVTWKIRFVVGANAAFLRFYGDLNDFLAPEGRGRTLPFGFDAGPSVKDAIEGLGVPHPEVDLIVVNGEPVDFSHVLASGDYVSVYPAFHSIDVSALPRLRPPLEGTPRFVLDVHLGRLAGYLRLMGFDALYRNDLTDPEIARIGEDERRVVLTRDRGLLKRSNVMYGYWVRHTEPRKQLVEILRRFDLAQHVDLFARCLICNAPLERVSKEAVERRLPPRTAESFQDFQICPVCDRVYWKGSHYRRMLILIGRALRAAS